MVSAPERLGHGMMRDRKIEGSRMVHGARERNLT
jgi:hypothetical protein